MAKKFIAGAIKRPGALRAKAQHAGLLGGKHDKLSYSDLVKLKGSKDPRTRKEALFALELRGFRHHS